MEMLKTNTTIESLVTSSEKIFVNEPAWCLQLGPPTVTPVSLHRNSLEPEPFPQQAAPGGRQNHLQHADMQLLRQVHQTVR